MPSSDGGSNAEKIHCETCGKPIDKKEEEEDVYDGAHPDMKRLERSVLCMPIEEWTPAGEHHLRRHHLLDLRCPTIGKSYVVNCDDLGSIKEAEFDCIRVNAWSILRALVKVANISETDADAYDTSDIPYAFWTPFTMLFEILPDLQRLLGTMEKAQKERPIKTEANITLLQEMPHSSPEGNPSLPKDDETGGASSKEKDTAPEGPKDEESDNSEELDALNEIEDLKFFIQFISSVFGATAERRKKIREAHESITHVSFMELRDLFCMNPTGDTLIARLENDNVLRLYQLVYLYGQDLRETELYQFRAVPAKPQARYGLSMAVIHWAFNGTAFTAVKTDIVIDPYEGLKPIRNIKTFPIRYLTSQEHSLLEKRAARFIRFAEVQWKKKTVLHKYYVGPPLDSSWVDVDNRETQSPYREHVDSEVIIDHEMAFQLGHSWTASSGGMPDAASADFDYFPSGVARRYMSPLRESGGLASQWAKAKSNEIFAKILETVEEIQGMEPKEAVEKGLSKYRLIPVENGVYAFILRNRRWARLDIHLIRPIVPEHSFDDLVIPNRHKMLVLAMVRTHAGGPRTAMPDQGRDEVHKAPHMDLIRGKGKGLIILLHGAPGVGKTSTAECVAEYTGRPLFPITCGDVGYDPTDVERNLENNFRLAHRWGCVLLLDEADVFLASRNKQDLKRNSIVSVFLRVLEYYSGILFLTTNRTGSLDEAFISRIHISLKYETLDFSSSMKIWEKNIRRLREQRPDADIDAKKILMFAEEHIDDLEWNGRQIRNAFQTAFALAEFEAAEKKMPNPRLNAQHFWDVAHTAKDFDAYLARVRGSDRDLARKSGLRIDQRQTARPRKSEPFTSRGSLFDDHEDHDMDRYESGTTRRRQPDSSSFGNRPRDEYADSSYQARSPSQGSSRQDMPYRSQTALGGSKDRKNRMTKDSYYDDHSDEQIPLAKGSDSKNQPTRGKTRPRSPTRSKYDEDQARERERDRDRDRDPMLHKPFKQNGSNGSKYELPQAPSRRRYEDTDDGEHGNGSEDDFSG